MFTYRVMGYIIISILLITNLLFNSISLVGLPDYTQLMPQILSDRVILLIRYVIILF